ncbi:MAG: hypothetical protein WCA10_08670 [Terracidiphilus sp.]
MKEFGVSELVLRIKTLETCHGTLQNADTLGRSVCNDDFLEILGKIFGGLKSACENLGTDSTLVVHLDALSKSFAEHSADRREAVILAQIEGVLDAIAHNLSKKKFLFFSDEEAGFYNNFRLFGESFKDKYSVNAFRESLSAGNCYAASQYTACVFHCMRVAEYGLRKLAANRNLRVKLTKNRRPCPIDMALGRT